MRIAADTNLLVRLVTQDNHVQSQIAFGLLSTAERAVVSMPTLCEFVWVLRSIYGFGPGDLDKAVRSVTEPGNVVTDRAAVEVGLKVQEAGGDFADGVIAHIGSAMGADVFVSFDRKAVARIKAIGMPAELAGARP